MKRVTVALLSLSLLATGCEPAAEEAAPQRTPIGRWSLGDPTATIGSVDGEHDAFSSIDGVLPTGDGGVQVLLSDERSIRTFGPDGGWLSSFGREGEGPGELGNPIAFGRVADSLWVIDEGNDRVSLYVDGEFARGEPFPAGLPTHDERSARVHGMLAGGRLLVVTDGRSITQPARVVEPSAVFAWSAGAVDTLGYVVSEYQPGFLQQWDGDSLEFMAMISEQPMGRTGLWAIAPGGEAVAVVPRTFAEGEPHSIAVAVVQASRGAGFSVNLGYRPVTVPLAVTDSLIGIYAEDGFSEEDVRGEVFLPDHYPTVSAVLFGTDGALWLRRDKVPGRDVVWSVISAQGQPLAEVTVPSELDIRGAEADAVWVHRTDELDVEYLERRPLVRG